MHRSPTVLDVARDAGVSPMSVSRVINNKKNVSGELRRRVLAAAKRVGYQPNLAGRLLRSQQATRVGVLYGNPSAAYLNELMLGVLEGAMQAGAQVEVERCNTPRGYRRAAERLLDAHVDGILLPSPVSTSLRTIHELKQADVSVIAVGTTKSVDGVSSIGMDDFKAACAITRYVIGLGHRNIAFIKGHSQHEPAVRRTLGFLDTTKNFGIDVPEYYIADGKFTFKSGLAAAERLLSVKPRPSAIVCSNDDMAAATIATALRLGISVPRDLSVTGFDDTPVSTIIWPTLTTVHQPVIQLGRRSVKMLIDELAARRDGVAPVPRHEVLNYKIIKRASTGAPATPSPHARRATVRR